MKIYKLPTPQECKFTKSGKRIACELIKNSPCIWVSQDYGTKNQKEYEAYRLLCRELKKWAKFFGLEVR